MNVTLRPIDSVTPYDKNPRKVPQKAIDAVANSLRLYGFRQPIVVDKDGVIIAGHTRRLGAQQLGMTEIPVHVADLSPEQARAYRLADNQTRELTDWDDDALAQELYELSQSSDEGLAKLAEMTAFDESELAKMIDAVNPPDEEAPLEAEPESRSERGQVWQLGKHRLMCGDSGVKEDVDRLLDGHAVTVVVTSPPYNLLNTTGAFPVRGAAWPMNTIQYGYPTHSDNMPHKEYVVWQRKCLELMMDTLDDDGAIFYNHKWRVQDGVMQDRADIVTGFPVRQIIIWDRGGSINFSDAFFLQNYEVIYLIAKPKFKLAPKASHIGAVWRVGPEQDNDHPAPFPIAIPERCIESTHEGDVYDPFVGSGTTLIAAERQNRTCYAMELEPQYVDMAIARWEQYTSQTAVLVD